MKGAAPDGKLKASDIVRVDRIPGFETNLLRTTVRVTQSGWALCLVRTWWPERGDIEASIEHRFSSSELGCIREALDRLFVVAPEPITCDDFPIRRIRFMADSGEMSFEVLEYDPFDRDIPLCSSAFSEAWDLIHQPFYSFITRQVAIRVSPES